MEKEAVPISTPSSQRTYSWHPPPTIRLVSRIFSYYFRSCSCPWVKSLALRSRMAYALRAARIFLFPRAHIRLFQSETYGNYVIPMVSNDLFHHLSRRYYLTKHLGLRERMQCLLSHYDFEDVSFDPSYKQQVYSRNGLVLWEKHKNDTHFQVRLMLADRYAAEGDLCVTLMVDGERLHSMFFSWVRGRLAQPKEPAIFVALNQGRWRKDSDYQEKFNAAFPNNSPNFACYAALQGLAQAVGAGELRAVSSRLQVCNIPGKDARFDNAYDQFWETVGGVPDATCGYVVPVPWPKKPLSEVASKHRARAASRRALLDEITHDVFHTIESHFHGTPLGTKHPAPSRSA